MPDIRNDKFRYKEFLFQKNTGVFLFDIKNMIKKSKEKQL